MLTISIDVTGKEPIYEQIYKYIRDEIRNGNIACGAKLPSGRGLASHLDVSRNTVDMAYGQLLSEGYIESKPKCGYFVCDLENLYLEGENKAGTKEKKTLPVPVIDVANKSGITTGNDIRNTGEEADLIDFSVSGVDMDYFPYSKWRKLMRECLIDDNKELFLAGNHQGDESLRRAVQSYLHQSRGVQCDAGQIVIGAGSDYMLLLLSKILGNGHFVAMENPAYRQACTIFENAGYDIMPVLVDDQGICVDRLELEKKKTGSFPDLVYVTPSHQFPLGNVMSASRRQQLLSWANKKEERYIIEDDYDSEFRYFGKPIPALQSQDPFGKVIYIGTLSKAIAPAIRLSYMVLPDKLLSRYYENAAFYFSTVSRIDQNVICHFFEQGHFERHLNRMRKIYKAKHDSLLTELKRVQIPFQISGESAGLHFIITLGPPSNQAEMMEQKFAQYAWKEGIRVYPVSDYYIQTIERSPMILLGFARLKEEEIIEGVHRFSKACECFSKELFTFYAENGILKLD